MMLNIENLKVSTKFRISEFSKFVGYKINIQESIASLYTNKELSKRESNKTIPFKITSKRKKYLGINLTKEIKYLYSEKYKTLMKESEDNTNKWKDIPCSWITIRKKVILLKWLYYPKQSTDLI